MLFSYVQGSGQAARHEGNLEAFVREKGMLDGTFIKKVIIGWTPSVDVFPPVEFAMVVFMGGIILCTTEDPIGCCVEAEASSGPRTSIPMSGHIVKYIAWHPTSCSKDA